MTGLHPPATIANMNRLHKGYTITILSAATFASASLFIKWAFGFGLNAWSFTLTNSVFTLLLLGALLRREPSRGWLPQRGARTGLLLFAACGAISTIAFNVSLFYLPMSLGTILFFTYPVWAALGTWLLFGQRPTRVYLLALLLALAGTVLTANLREAAQAELNPIGIALALLTGVSHGMYLVLGERVLGGVSAVVATTVTRVAILAGVLLLNPKVVLELGTIPVQGWAISAVAALFAGVAPFLLLNTGVALIGANRAAIASTSELPFALAFGLLLLGELILPLQWTGAGLITAAVVLIQWQSYRQRNQPSLPGDRLAV